MSLRIPLYAQFLAWAGLNVLLIAASLYAYAPRNESGLNLFLTDAVRDRLAALARDFADDLYEVDPAAWGPIMIQHQTTVGVSWSARVAGGPPSFRSDRSAGHGPFDSGSRARSDFNGPPPLDKGPPGGFGGPPGMGPGPPPAIEIARRAHDQGYEVTVFIEGARLGGPPRGFLIVADTDGFRSLLRLLGLSREAGFVTLLVLMSAVLWWPFIWRITRTVRQLSLATERISRGRFDTRLAASSWDELGDLATSANAMAERLERLLSGQRQFVADVAHEVISPIARMQIGLGILEVRVSESARPSLNDVREELDGMAAMLNELLLFSRTGVEAARAAPVPSLLHPLIKKVVDAEARGACVIVDVADELVVNVPEALLSRALANLIRNATRYGAAGAEPVRVAAWLQDHLLLIVVQDRGPGVHESSLARLGEPFFRPELSRNRETGGYGLGLAIVKRCILGCDGEVTFKNREGGGFEAIISLQQSK